MQHRRHITQRGARVAGETLEQLFRGKAERQLRSTIRERRRHDGRAAPALGDREHEKTEAARPRGAPEGDVHVAREAEQREPTNGDGARERERDQQKRLHRLESRHDRTRQCEGHERRRRRRTDASHRAARPLERREHATGLNTLLFAHRLEFTRERRIEIGLREAVLHEPPRRGDAEDEWRRDHGAGDCNHAGRRAEPRGDAHAAGERSKQREQRAAAVHAAVSLHERA